MGSGRLSWLFAPWHVAALATGAKSFRDNPVIGSPALNRAGVHIARVRLAHRMAEWRRQRLSALVCKEDRAAFERDGFILKPNFLPAADYAALKEQVLRFRGPVRHQLQGDAMTRRIALDRRTLAHLPALRGLVESSQWLGLVRYVGSYMLEPLVYIQTIFSHVRAAPPDPQTRLHADAFHPSVKAWFFLTDVAEEDGPLIYVPGSHRLTPERLAWEQRMSLSAPRAADADTRQGSFRVESGELRALGLPEPRVFAVPANTLIVADTFGFHARGPSAGRSVRVEIWAYGRRSPFVPWPGLDLWSGAGLARRSLLCWQLGDLMERTGIKPHRWHLRRGISAFDSA